MVAKLIQQKIKGELTALCRKLVLAFADHIDIIEDTTPTVKKRL